MLKRYLAFVIVFIIFLPLTEVNAQEIPCDPTSQPCTPPGAPIDGGVALLLAIGLGYGIKKMRDTK